MHKDYYATGRGTPFLDIPPTTLPAITAPGRFAFDPAPKPLFVDVITTPRDNPNTIHDARTINYHSDGARKWLAKHCYWAITNGYAVHTAKSEGK